MKMLAAKEIEKFISSSVYIDTMGEQYNQGYQLGLREGVEMFPRYAKWMSMGSGQPLILQGTCHWATR